MEALAGRDPRHVGPFALTGRLASGSVGTVFAARSASGRKVAVKVVHEHLARDPLFRASFAADLAAARQVGGISAAQVVDGDPDAEVPWVATRFVDGPSLADRVAEAGPLPVEEVFALAAGIAEGLGSIHAAGLVHGALRPGNVIMSADGPQVIDFQIGRLPEATVSGRDTGRDAGPAGAAGAADMLALGGILHFAATGGAPHGDGHLDLAVLTEPRLRALVAGCLADDPAARPTSGQVRAMAAEAAPVVGPTVAVLRADVLAGRRPDSETLGGTDAGRTGEPVSLGTVEPDEGATERFGSQPADRPTPDLGGRTERALLAAKDGRPNRAGRLGGTLSRRAVLAGAGVAVAAVAGGVTWRLGAFRRDESATGGAGGVATAANDYRELAGHLGSVYEVAFAPDGKTVASANSNATGTIWDAVTGTLGHRLVGHRFQLQAIDYAPDSRTVATGCADGTVVIWDTRSGTALRTLPIPGSMSTGIAFAPDGATLATLGRDGVGRIWNLRDGALVKSLRGHDEFTTVIRFAPDGKSIATADSTAVRIWDVATGALVRTLHDARQWVAYSPNGSDLATLDRDKTTVTVRDVATGAPRRQLVGHTNGVIGGAFSKDGTTLVTASYDRTARLWDVAAGTTRITLNGHTDAVLGADIAPDGRSVVTGGRDGTTRLWSAGDGRALHVSPPVREQVFAVRFARSGRTLLTAGMDGTARLWDVASGSQLRSLVGHRFGVRAVAWAPDGRSVATGGVDGTVRVWDAAAGTARHVLPHPAWVQSVDYAPDGRSLATCDGRGTLRFWDAVGGNLRGALPLDPAGLAALAYAPDGRTVAVGGTDRLLRLVDATDGQVRRVLRGHIRALTAVRFAPGGTILATGSDDGTVRLWDVASGSTLITLLGHLGTVTAVAFAPSGKVIATAGADRTVRLWDVRSGAALHTFTDYEDLVSSVDFPPDHTTLVTGCWDGSVRLRDLARIPGLSDVAG